MCQSRQGTDWLIERWTRLAAIAREVGAWNEDQRRLAFDMLGVPRDLRNLTIDVPAADDATALIALAEKQIAKLREDQVAVLDELNAAAPDARTKRPRLGPPTAYKLSPTPF